jgi:hypothetical protein
MLQITPPCRFPDLQAFLEGDAPSLYIEKREIKPRQNAIVAAPYLMPNILHDFLQRLPRHPDRQLRNRPAGAQRGSYNTVMTENHAGFRIVRMHFDFIDHFL